MDPNSEQQQQQQQVSLDDLIQHYLSKFSSTQLIQSILVSLPSIFDAQQTFITVFTDAHDPSSSSSSSLCTSTHTISSPPPSWDNQNPNNNIVHKTIISQFNLQCSTFLIGLPASSYFTGCLVGALALAVVGDSWVGRKVLLFFSCLLMSLSALATAFSLNIWMYSALRLVSGIGRVGITTSALVLVMERVGKQRRGRVGMIRFFCFTLGFLSLPAIAYLNRNNSWKSLYFCTSIPSICYCIVAYLFVHESPRWLFMHARQEHARAILKKLAPRSAILNSSLQVIKTQESNSKSNNLILLFNKKWVVKRVLATMGLGFGVGIVYFGMILGVGNLGFSTYLTLTFNALLLIPSQLLIFFSIEKINRRGSLLVFCATSGLCSIVCALIGSNKSKIATTSLELASFFCASSAYNLLMIYSTELFPTCIRNSATTIVRLAVLVGPVFVPMLVSKGKRSGVWWSYGVFGVTIGVCGLFVLCLPETRGTILCDTMEEQEGNDNIKNNTIVMT